MKETIDRTRADAALKARARRLRELHQGPVLVLPNAWDAASAVLVVREGARAVATTSGGIAWSLGFPDGERVSREAMLRAVEAIARAVQVPVTADLEGGYGPKPEDVEATVRGAIAAGAAGINLEDSRAPGGPLFSVEEQAARLGAAREAASAGGLPEMVINARTDVFLFENGAPAQRMNEVLSRAAAYASAGSDCLFVPGLVDLDRLKSLAASSPLPINVMAGPGAPTVAELGAAGVRRVSLGTALAQAAYTTAQRAARELLTSGTYGMLEGAIGYGELNGMFRG